MLYISTISMEALAMPIMSMRQNSQDSSGVIRAASKAPVFLTNRGKTTHVVMSIEEYERMNGKKKSIVDMLRHPESDHIEFDPPKLEGPLFIPADLS
jgi:prevent-host-death family protein